MPTSRLEQKVPLFRVFIASPCDVKAERQAAMDVLEEVQRLFWASGSVRIQPVAWDDPNARLQPLVGVSPQSVVNRCKGLPRGCELTVMILWGRIGTPPHPPLPNGKAYASGTVWEYENAREGRVDVWLYHCIRDQLVPIHLSQDELDECKRQSESVQKFVSSVGGIPRRYHDVEDFRRSFREDLEDHLKQFMRQSENGSLAVSTGGPEELDSPPRLSGGDVAQQLRPPLNVPPGDPHWIKRVADLERLENALLHRAAGLQVLALHGMPGVGKSVLAQDIASSSRVLEAFPDGVVWIKVGREPQLCDLLGTARRDLERAIPNAHAARHAKETDEQQLLRYLLWDKSCLIVLDDVWSRDAAEPFRAALGQSCALLITTRERRVAQQLGAEVVEVDVLTLEQVSQLLTRLSGGIRPQQTEAQQIADGLGYLPLALAQLGPAISGPNPWGDVVRLLRTAHDDVPQSLPLDEVLNAFRASDEALAQKEPTARECYVTLAVFPRSAQMAERVLVRFWAQKVKPDEVHHIIGVLYDASLVRYGERDCYVLHDLQHDCLRRRCAPSDLRSLHERLLSSLENSLERMHEDAYLLQHAPYHLVHAGRLVDCETLLRNSEWLKTKLEQLGPEATVADLVLAINQRDVDHHPAIDLAPIVTALIEAVSTDKRTRWHELRGALVHTFGGYDAWPSELRRVLEARPDRRIRIFVGDTWDREGAYAKAEDCFGKLLKDARVKGDLDQEADGAVRLAQVYRHRGLHRSALKLLETCSKHQPDHGRTERDMSRIYWVQYHRAISLKDCGQFSAAEDLLKWLAPRVEELKHSPGWGPSVRHQMAALLLDRLQFPLPNGDRNPLAEAEQLLLECLERRRSLGDFRTYQDHRRLGQIYALRGRFPEADKHFLMAVDEALRYGDRRHARSSACERCAYVLLGRQLVERRAPRVALHEIHLECPRSSACPDTSCSKETLWTRAFRVAAARRLGYLPLLDGATGALTGECALWDTVHGNSDAGSGLWHPTVTVLVFDSDRRELALQLRSERDSHGKLDASVTGHQEVGETDAEAAIREAREELDLALERAQLLRVGRPYAFRKRGSPSTDQDCHEDSHLFHYAKSTYNNERTSVFVAILDEAQERRLRERSDVEWHCLSELRALCTGLPGCASGLRQLLHSDVLAAIEGAVSRAGDRLGIEFFVTGSAGSRKTDIAQRLVQSYGGADFDSAFFNRFFSWIAVMLSKSESVDGESNEERVRYVSAYLKRHLAIESDGRIIFRQRELSSANGGEFQLWLEEVIRDIQIEPDWRVLFRGWDITRDLTSDEVEQRMELQRDRTYSYRAQLNPFLWKQIHKLKIRGPVFLLGKKRSSVRTAVRAIYLDASGSTSDPADLERLRCDVIIDTSTQSPDDTAAAVGREYEKARLAGRMDFHGLRALYTVPRELGRQKMEIALQKGRGLVVAADQDCHGQFTAAHGHRLDLLAYHQSVLGGIVAGRGGTLITWGSDKTVLFFPDVREAEKAKHMLECIQLEYLSRTQYRLGIGVLNNYEALPPKVRVELELHFGLFVDQHAGQTLVAFEMGTYDTPEAALERQLALINAQLSDGLRLEASLGWVVPMSTVSLGGVLVERVTNVEQLDQALDSAFCMLAEAKSRGRNTRVVREAIDVTQPSAPELQLPREVVNAVRKALREPTLLCSREQREEFPSVLRMGAMERLLTEWLHEKPGRKGFLLSTRTIYRRKDALFVPECLSDAQGNLEFGWGPPFDELAQRFCRRDCELLVSASLYYTRTCVRDWLLGMPDASTATIRGRALEGLKPPLDAFWVLEGNVPNDSVQKLLGSVRRCLWDNMGVVDVGVVGILVPVAGANDGRELLARVETSRKALTKQTLSREHCTLLGVWLPKPRRQDEVGRDKAQRADQELALEKLRDRERKLAPWGTRFAPIQFEVVRRLQAVLQIQSIDPAERQVKAVGAALDALRDWPAELQPAILEGIGRDPAAASFRVLLEMWRHRWRSDVEQFVPGRAAADDVLHDDVCRYVLKYSVPFLGEPHPCIG